MKNNHKKQSMGFTIVITFFLCNWSLAMLVNNADEIQVTSALPKFLKEPPSIVYYATTDDQHAENQLPVFDLEAVVYPSNATVTIATAQSDDPENYLFLPILRTSNHIDRVSSAVHFKHPYAILLRSSALTFSKKKHETQFWMARVFNLPVNTIIHLLASTVLGTVRSRSIKLMQMELPGFPRYADESLSLLIGNTGRIVCHLPRAQPSLPAVSFYHNGARLDLSDSNRFRLIYLGGDGTGIPWENRIIQYQQHQQQHANPNHIPEQLFTKPMPSAAVLLIHPLRITDSGEYRCQARLGSKEVFAEQRTLLNVTKPREKVPARLQFSSDDPEISYLYSHLISSVPAETLPTAQSGDSFPDTTAALVTSTRVVLTVPEGMNLTLFCTYEAAPVVSTRWFFDGQATNVKQESQFGVLSISNVDKSNELTYTCAPHTPGLDASRKSFKIQVLSRKKLEIDPSPVITVGSGQNISIRCGYSVEKSLSIPTNALSLSKRNEARVEFQHVQLGTDFGWYHNGKRIEIKQKYGKVFIDVANDAMQLHIINVSNYDQGLYQCWTLDSSGIWSTISSAVTMGTDAVQLTELQESRTEDGLIRERTLEGLTGHMTCNISSIIGQISVNQAGLDLRTDDVVIVWYRGASDSEPIDLSGTQTGGIKYLRSTVDWASQILSIVNPRKSKDDGLYSCRVYDRQSNSFLGEIKFELIIDSAGENSAEELRKDESMQITVPRTASSKQMKTDAMGTVDILDVNPDSQSIPTEVKSALEREFQISKPRVRRMSNFTTTLHVSWSVVAHETASQYTYYEIQLRSLKSDTELQSVRVRREATIVTETEIRAFSLSDGHWTLPSRIAIVEMANEACLNHKQEIEPGGVYSVRVIGIARPDDQMEFDSEMSIKSPWSDRISFQNLINIQPAITTFMAPIATKLKLEWSLPTNFTWKTPPEPSASMYINVQALLTQLLPERNGSWPQKSRWKACQEDRETRTPVVEQQIYLGSWQVNNNLVPTKPFQSTISNLEPNTTYAVAIYGILEYSEKYMKTKSSQWFTLLSAEAIETTLSEDSVSSNFVSTSLDNGNNKLQGSITEGNGKGALQKQPMNSKAAQEHDSYILVVILGSLAGVLLVISLALIALCIWYHLRTKRLVYQEANESPNKLGYTTSSVELPSTPNGYLLNTANPVLNFMDSSYQTNFTGSPQMQHLAISNPSLLQFAELQSLYQLAGCGPQAWSTLPYDPGDKSQRQQWISAELTSTSKSNETQLNSMIYPYNTETQPVLEPTVNRTAKMNLKVDFTIDSMLPKGHQRADEKRSSMDALVGNSGERFSSTGASDTEDGDGTRIIQNDQSSSIYSHIGSESTLNELPPKLLDRHGCFSPQPPPPPQIGTGPFGPYHDPRSQALDQTDVAPENPPIQRPIPTYLTAPTTQSVPFSSPAIWNTSGPLPDNQGNFRPGVTWLNQPALQTSWLAKQQQQQIAPNGQYPSNILDANMLPDLFSMNQSANIFYRTLPNRKTNDNSCHQNFMGNPEQLNYNASSRTSVLLSSAILNSHKQRETENAHSGTQGSFPPSMMEEDCSAEPVQNEHPNSQFILKYWMVNNSKNSEALHEPLTTIRDVQSPNKPNSKENGQGSRSIEFESEIVESDERKHELNHVFGDSGVDLHASVNNKNYSHRQYTEEPDECQLSHWRKKRQLKFSNRSTLLQHRDPGQEEQTAEFASTKRSDTSNDATGGSVKSTQDRPISRKRPYSEFSSQSSVASIENPVPGSPSRLLRRPSADTWQLREPLLERQMLDAQPVSPHVELPSNSSSI